MIARLRLTICVCSVAACGAETINDICPPNAAPTGTTARITIEFQPSLPDPFAITAGNSVHLMAIVTERDECGEIVQESHEAPVSWASSSADVATVYRNGVVHAHRAGLTEISASFETAVAKLRLQVVPVGTVPAMSALVSGAGQSCAIGVDGVVYCWGGGIPSFCNEVGGGFECGADYTTGVLASYDWPFLWTTCSYGGPQSWSDPHASVSDFPCSRVPSPYNLGADVSVIGVGGHSTFSRIAVCGLSDAGTIRCTESPGPVQILSGGVYESVSVAPGHACALDQDGRAHCWGDNGYGALGDSTRISHDDPQPVHGDRQYTALGSAFHLTCALDVDGHAYCWGARLWNAGSPELESCDWSGPAPGVPCSLIPRAVSDTVFEQLSVGGTNLVDAHACGLTADGTGYCWGGNYDGSLGDGTTERRAEPTRVGGGLRFRSISAGGSHTCGIAVSGTAYCWGSNMAGQLGHPGILEAPLPVEVTGVPVLERIAAGGWHTCGLTTDGIVYCWGANEGGQLGNGELPDQDTPTRIAGQG